MLNDDFSFLFLQEKSKSFGLIVKIICNYPEPLNRVKKKINFPHFVYFVHRFAENHYLGFVRNIHMDLYKITQFESHRFSFDLFQLFLLSVMISTWEILPYMAVFESVHRTADVGSSMDTFLCG